MTIFIMLSIVSKMNCYIIYYENTKITNSMDDNAVRHINF